MPRRSLSFSAPFIVLLLFLASPSVIAFYTDWLWFGEVGYQQAFTIRLIGQGSLFIVTFAVAAAWLLVNARIALAANAVLPAASTSNAGIYVSPILRMQVQALVPSVATVCAVLMAVYASGQWLTWWSWHYAVPFGDVDPIVGRDVSFYVFALPFLQSVRVLAQALIVIAGLGSATLYLVSGALTADIPPTRLSAAPAARRHLALLAAAFFVTVAFGAWLGRMEYLISRSALMHGATYADVHGRMPAAFVLVIVGIAGAVLSVVQATSRRNWPVPAAIGLCVVVWFGGEMYSSGLQRFVVSPNEQARETPYIQHNIDATRRAFALDAVDEQELSGDAPLTQDDITRNSATLENVRLWDHQPLLDTFGQLQEIRTYYDFVSVDNDRYSVNGAYRQVMLSARELNSGSLPSRTWVNERLTFTHGYGITLGPVNEVTPEGLPVLFVQNLPPETRADLPLLEPSIYFGELSNDYVIVNTNTREFHYPQGDDNVFTTYAGRGGVPLSSFWRKVLFAMRFGAYQILLSDAITPESRIVFNRNIHARVSRIAPFLTLDRDPYLVTADGHLFWMYDAYTISGQYPYSTPSTPGVNYIRNSVKVVIDVYHGTTTLYLADPTDPLIATYARVFPDLFRPLDEMPVTLRAHVRYPEDLFAMQASMYSTYHMTQPALFYNREDQWDIPGLDDNGQVRAMEPYYTIMRLPGEEHAEFIQMLPFTPRRKDNLAAWLVARSDGEQYGRLRAFQFPKRKLVYGPRQVVARISQDQVIAPQITLWNQQGSSVIWGTLMVIPIEESLIYVRPLYLRASGGRIPALTRVVVAYQNQIVMEETLEAGLARIFGGGVPGEFAVTTTPVASSLHGGVPLEGPDTPPAVAKPRSSLAIEAGTYYDRAIEAARVGDWTSYGEAIRLLGRTLDAMKGP